MTIPFLDTLKKKLGRPQKTAPAAPVSAPRPVEKRSSERLSKTVMPNTTRTVLPQESFEMAAHSGPVSATAAIAPSAAARPVAFSLASPSEPSLGLPPAVARALEPEVERVISLDLREVVHQVPNGWIRPVSEAEAGRRVLLKAAELEKGMSNGRPTVSLTSIYKQVPEIFLQPVPDAENSQVPLPFNKVLEQFTGLQTRADQQRDQVVPQVETPFLRVTLEDNSKFGTKFGPIETSDAPPVKVQPALAETIAAAEPEALVREKVAPAPISIAKPAPARVRLTLPHQNNGDAPVAQTAAPPASPAPAATPTRIAFKISPIGTGAPASERVPASSGPSVPNTVKPVAFSLDAAVSEPSKKSDEWLTKENFPDESAAIPQAAQPIAAPNESKAQGAQAERKVSLPLKPILQSLPPFQLTDDITAVPADAKIEFPFSLVGPQLASGRVAINPDDFGAALPAEYKNLFTAEQIATPIALPLQEVLKSLPAAILRMRDDQEEQEKGGNFETPFAAKAQEDAQRFKVATPAPVLPAVTEPQRVDGGAAQALQSNRAAVTDPGYTERPAAEPAEAAGETTAKAIVTRASKMAGVKACAIMFADGLSLAGNLPEEYEAEGLCAMAPTLLQRIENHMTETQLGGVRAMTLFCTRAAISFFMDENLCLAALHSQDLSADVRAELERALHDLSQKYSHPA